MFDPTIYENLKVILEGIVYDLDLSGKLEITNRRDLVDLARMSRMYSIRVRDTKNRFRPLEAEVVLHTELQDLAGEILEQQHISSIGCHFTVKFYLSVQNIESECPVIEKMIKRIWAMPLNVTQRLAYTYGMPYGSYDNEITLEIFDKINEENSEKITSLVERVIITFENFSRR